MSSPVDWNAGRYEWVAAQLAPVAERVVKSAAIEPGARVLDLACGTGNAALAAARAGGRVTGLDGSLRLLDVARARAREARVDATFMAGDMHALPFATGTFDIVISLFGLIFAREPAVALGEALRVLRLGGRVLVVAWRPEGALHAMVGALASAAGSGSEPFAWHDPRAVAALVDGIVVSDDGSIVLVDDSPEAYLSGFERHHPLALALLPSLVRAGRGEATRARALAALRDANEDGAGFRITVPYRVLRLDPPRP